MGVGIIVACCPALRVLLRTAGERSTGQNSGGTCAREKLVIEGQDRGLCKPQCNGIQNVCAVYDLASVY
jgi:hypothetical protein